MCAIGLSPGSSINAHRAHGSCLRSPSNTAARSTSRNASRAGRDHRQSMSTSPLPWSPSASRARFRPRAGTPSLSPHGSSSNGSCTPRRTRPRPRTRWHCTRSAPSARRHSRRGAHAIAALAPSLGWASVLSSDVNRPSRRLHTQRPPLASLLTTRTTQHPALIRHEVLAGARRRTAIPARPGARRPVHAGNPHLFLPRPEAARPACHARCRGFESL
jgi:hypothetical protein